MREASASFFRSSLRLAGGAIPLLSLIVFHPIQFMAKKEVAAAEAADARFGTVPLEVALAEAALERGYIPASFEQASRAEDAFVRLLSGERTTGLERELAVLGFELAQVSAGNETLTLVREASDQLAGKGAYVFRQGGEPVLLQAPHRFKDLDTGTLVRKLLEERNFRAASWNTVPRWYEENGLKVDADLAHIGVSYFNAFGRAFARLCSGGCVVQLHGFDQSKRTTPEGQAADLIISAGTKTPSTAARSLAKCLAAKLAPETVLLYPEEVTELGGTTNENGRALRAMGVDGFIHVEIARELRQRLVDEPKLRDRFADCVARL